MMAGKEGKDMDQEKNEKSIVEENNEQELTLEKFEEASEIVKEVTSETKLIYSEYFSSITGNKVYLKPENMQYTGAYKVRGAYYKISTLSEDEKKKGLITASAGNHAPGRCLCSKARRNPGNDRNADDDPSDEG